MARLPSGRDGKYVTRAMGHEDYVHVCTALRDGAIVDCKVLAHSGTVGIGNCACARVPAAIVAHRSLERSSTLPHPRDGGRRRTNRARGGDSCCPIGAGGQTPAEGTMAVAHMI